MTRAYELFHCDNVTYNLDDYKMIVATVCSYLADINRVLDESDKGLQVDKEYVKTTLLKLEEAKELLLKIKDFLGLEGGLDAFQKDLTLFGAEFRHGRFKATPGHEEIYKEETHRAAEKFINGFPSLGKPFNYEAMMMVLFFCFPLDKVDYNKKSNATVSSWISKIKNIWHKKEVAA